MKGVFRNIGGVAPVSALCHYPVLVAGRLSNVTVPKLLRGMGVVTEGKSGLQASSDKGFTKDFCSAAFVTLR